MATESLVILSDRLDMYLVEGMSFLKRGYNVESYWSLARLTLAAIWRDYPANAPVFESRVQRVFADVLLESMKQDAVNA